MKNKKIIYYETYEDDVVKNKNQDYNIKKNYKWIHNNIIYRFFSNILYVIAYILSFFYCKFFLHVKIKNRKILNKYKKQGFFLYGNHTQNIGDVFIPGHVCKNKRIYTIVSQANLGLAGIGPLLPMLGAIPIPNSINDTKKMCDTISKKIEQKKCIVIYPEAHVWPYYTKIRPYPDTSFKFPIECDAASFAFTTTYYKRKFGKKPGIVVYVDGPFLPDKNISKKKRQEKLHNEIHECMIKRSTNSTYEYIEYKGEKTQVW